MTIMKIKNIFLTLAVAVASSACSDWFDVSPKTDIKTDDLFKDETGFQSALTGCYGNMTKDKTYGDDLHPVSRRADQFDCCPAHADHLLRGRFE